MNDSKMKLPKSLTVTASPSQSAFFAGELFTAQITFTNSAAPGRAADYGGTASSRSRRTAVSTGVSSKGPGSRGERPPNTSQINLAEYTSNNIEEDDDTPSSSSNRDGTPSGSGSRIDTRSHSRGYSASVTDLSTRRDLSSAGFSPISPQFDSRRLSTTVSPHSGSPFTAQLPVSSSTVTLPTRKGLIGKPLIPSAPPRHSAQRVGNASPPARKRSIGPAHLRSQSMAISNPELVLDRSGGMADINSATAASSSSNLADPSSSTINHSPSSRRRPEAIQISTPSPNRRQFSANSSTTSLAISEDFDPLDESAAAVDREQNFYRGGQNEAMDDATRVGLDERARMASRWEEGSRSAGAGTTEFQRRHSISSSSTRARSASAAAYPNGSRNSNAFLHPPNSLILLWSFVHLEGTFEVDDTLIKASEFNEVKRSLLAGFGSGIGGGTLDERKQASGWRNWLWGKDPERTTAGASLEERKATMMNDKSVPTFSSPPSILGIDVILEPGESKTYTFSIPIPADLPPSFRGKAIKFSYHLVLGTNQSPLAQLVDPSSLSARNSISRLMKVPIRIYNHVAITGARPFYDLTNPIVYHRDEASVAGDDIKLAIRTRRPSTGRQDFEDYASSLLDSVSDRLVSPFRVGSGPPPSPVIRLREKNINMESVPALRPEMRERTKTGSVVTLPDLADPVIEEEEEIVGCKAAVEIVSRNSKKVSYDINKDGYMVASLTLVKSAYRLGETVIGSIVINSGDGRVLRVSARLETHELVETSIATKPAHQMRELTRRLHAEHHEMTLDSARVGLALSIPSGATPDFATSGVKLQWSVRLSFLVIPPSPDSPMPSASDRSNSGQLHAPTPVNSATSSSSVNPGKGHARSKSFGYGFEPAVALTLPAPPSILPTGATHLMPVLGSSLDPHPFHTSYRAVPDLGFVPVLFSSTSSMIDAVPSPGPLQRSVRGGMHQSTPSLSSIGGVTKPLQQPSVVLVPAKIETVECSIPIKIYPGNTAFRPAVVTFSA